MRTYLQLTSPGLLLIVGVVLAGGIGLLDLFYLHPLVNSYRETAMSRQADHVEKGLMLAVQSSQDSLGEICYTWTHTRQAALLCESPSPASWQAFLGSVSSAHSGDAAWLSDSGGSVLSMWGDEKLPGDFAARLSKEVRQFHEDSSSPAAGLVQVDGALVQFRVCPLDSHARPGCVKTLAIARRVPQSVLMSTLPDAKGVDFIAGASLPMTAYSTKTCAWQLSSNSNDLVVNLVLTDSRGTALGYLQATTPVSQGYRQGVAARRIVLIILSLSVGLVLLIIMGMHMLVSGPVIRLLRRLQQIEAGQKTAKDLTQDLHGEPLVLARRLESVFERLAHQSKTDSLTGIANRRHFQEVFNCFYHQARRYNRPLSLLVMDMDDFKLANDSRGHAYGDSLLQMVTAQIEKCCRKADLPARLGGDEFAVLMPETTAGDAYIVAERIRQGVGAGSAQDPAAVPVTLSMGIADLNSGEIDSPEAMASLADRAMYTAKETGRNRVVQAHDLGSLTWPVGSESGGHVDTLRSRVAGLENQVREFFVRAIEEMFGLLRERDPHMADHSGRVRRCSAVIGQEMGLPDRVIQRLEMAAMLHDMGMIAMPDNILMGPGPLNGQQQEVMRRHPLLSVRIMEGIHFLDQEIPTVRYHHERFDGTGYPEGLKGAEIPLTARIMAVADALVALTSPRFYRDAKSLDMALQEIRKCAGTQFDPVVVDALTVVAKRTPEELARSEERIAKSE